jgi:hypothetical protein
MALVWNAWMLWRPSISMDASSPNHTGRTAALSISALLWAMLNTRLNKLCYMLL